MNKVYFITDDNGSIHDLLVGEGDVAQQQAYTTLDYYLKKNDTWLKYRLISMIPDGKLHKESINAVTVVKMNGQPVRAVLNNFINLLDLINTFSSMESEYRHYTYETKYIKIN